jgi:hypothetical protein
MRRRREEKVQLADNTIDFAWKVHTAVVDWTAKVDTKAAIVLSLGGALLGFFVTLSSTGRALADLHGWRSATCWVGVAAVGSGVLFAAFVVMPRLHSRRARQEWADNYIYFGHLRHWKANDLRSKLRTVDREEQLASLSVQLVAGSRIAWRKHRLLQVSMYCIVIGVVLVALAAAWPHG